MRKRPSTLASRRQTTIFRVKICFHKSNLPALPSVPGRACLTSPGWVRKFLPGGATARWSRGLWLTGRSIFREVVRIRSPSFSLTTLAAPEISRA